jgi:hypothetical protein
MSRFIRLGIATAIAAIGILAFAPLLHAQDDAPPLDASVLAPTPALNPPGAPLVTTDGGATYHLAQPLPFDPIAWLQAGAPPHWQIIALLLWALLSEVLAHAKSLQPNSALQLLVALLRRTPLVAKIAPALLLVGFGCLLCGCNNVDAGSGVLVLGAVGAFLGAHAYGAFRRWRARNVRCSCGHGIARHYGYGCMDCFCSDEPAALYADAMGWPPRGHKLRHPVFVDPSGPRPSPPTARCICSERVKTPRKSRVTNQVGAIDGYVIVGPSLVSHRRDCPDFTEADREWCVAWRSPGRHSLGGGSRALALLLPPLLFCTLFAGSGCAAFYRQPVALQHAEADALKCGTAGVQQLMQQEAPGLLDALAGDNASWVTDLESRAATVGEAALMCAVGHALYDALGADGVAAVAEVGPERAIERRLELADAGAMQLASPHRRVLERGLVWLRAHRPQDRAAR